MEEQRNNTAIVVANDPPGRPAGIPNRANLLLREAALLAADIAGNDLENPHGLPGFVNYLRCAALAEMPAFLGLLGKILPTQVSERNGDDVVITHIDRVIIHADGRDYRAIAEDNAPEVSDAESVRTTPESS
jgi:hypothetical protein